MLWSKLINDDALSELMLLLRAKISKASLSCMKLGLSAAKHIWLGVKQQCVLLLLSLELSIQISWYVFHNNPILSPSPTEIPNWWRPGQRNLFDPPSFVLCREVILLKMQSVLLLLFPSFFPPTRNSMCIFYSYSSLSCWCLSICHCLRETSSVLLLTSWPQGP
jgi:hypothetical protein